MRKVTTITWLTSMPRRREAFWLAATARMALPMRDFRMKRPRPAMRTREATSMRICARLIRKPPVPPMKKGLGSRTLFGKRRVSAPKTASAMETRTSEAPIELIIAESLSALAPSRRSGRKARSSRRRARREPAIMAAASPRGRGRPAWAMTSQPTKAQHMKVAAWARLSMSRTPKMRVKPIAKTP